MSYSTLLAAALVELAESCCCVFTARWEVFPSPGSNSLGNLHRALLPMDEGLGSPSMEDGEDSPGVYTLLIVWGKWEGRRWWWWSLRLGES